MTQVFNGSVLDERMVNKQICTRVKPCREGGAQRHPASGAEDLRHGRASY